jgi:hypothetical protein
MEIDFRDEQPPNKSLPSTETRVPASNVILERDVQFTKQESEIVSTDAGMQSDLRDEHP